MTTLLTTTYLTLPVAFNFTPQPPTPRRSTITHKLLKVVEGYDTIRRLRVCYGTGLSGKHQEIPLRILHLLQGVILSNISIVTRIYRWYYYTVGF